MQRAGQKDTFITSIIVRFAEEEVQLVQIITHRYAIGEENGIPLYICRKPKIDIEKWWKDYEEHLFD